MNSGDNFSLKTFFNSNFQTLGAMESLESLGVPLTINICEVSKEPIFHFLKLQTNKGGIRLYFE